MDKKISIISIIYRVEDYLERCIQSLISQTYRNLEIILVVGVKDGIENACVEIARRYAEQDERIKLIVAPARGAADARNVGLKAATGDYIGFVDGDDYVEPDMFESMLRDMTESDSEIAVCGIYHEFVNKTVADQPSGLQVMSPQRALEIILNGEGFFLHLWDKLYAKRIFEGVTFSADFVVEDRNLVNRLIARADRLCYRSDPKYHYLERNESGSTHVGYALDNALANRALCDFVREKFPELENTTNRFYLQEVITSYQNLLTGDVAEARERRDLRREIRQAKSLNAKNPLVGKNLRIKAVLALCCPVILKEITKRHKKSNAAENVRFS